MISDKWITQKEMRDILSLCEKVQALGDANSRASVGLDIFGDAMVVVRDENGDVLGHIGLVEAPGGFEYGLWLDNGEDESTD